MPNGCDNCRCCAACGEELGPLVELLDARLTAALATIDAWRPVVREAVEYQELHLRDIMDGGTAMTAPIDTAELRRLLAEATPQPWCVHPNGTSVWRGDEYDSSGTLPDHDMVLRAPFLAAAATSMRRAVDDLEAVVALRNAAPALLDELDRLRADSIVLRAELDSVREALGTDRLAASDGYACHAVRVLVEETTP